MTRADGWIAFGHTVREALGDRQGYARKARAGHSPRRRPRALPPGCRRPGPRSAMSSAGPADAAWSDSSGASWRRKASAILIEALDGCADAVARALRRRRLAGAGPASAFAAAASGPRAHPDRRAARRGAALAERDDAALRAEPDDADLARAVRPDADRSDGVRRAGRRQRQRRDAGRGRRRRARPAGSATWRRGRARSIITCADPEMRATLSRRRPSSGPRRDFRLAGRGARAPRLLRGIARRRRTRRMVKRLRVAILADYLEEEWPSMDLVADMLMRAPAAASMRATVDATLVRPPMPRRLTRLRGRGAGAGIDLDRVAGAAVGLSARARGASAAASTSFTSSITATRTSCTRCPPAARSSPATTSTRSDRSCSRKTSGGRLPFRLDDAPDSVGLRTAAHVPCDSEATRDALVALAGFPAGSAVGDSQRHRHRPAMAGRGRRADVEAARLLGPRGTASSCCTSAARFPRKRIDVLLDVFAGVRPSAAGRAADSRRRSVHRRAARPRARARRPRRDRRAAVRRSRDARARSTAAARSRCCRPSAKDSACRWSRRSRRGTPMVASDIPVLREIGGDAVTYCPVGDTRAWATRSCALLDERESDAASAGRCAAAAAVRARGRLQLVALRRARGRPLSRHRGAAGRQGDRDA